MPGKPKEPHVLLTVRSTAGTWEGARFNRNNKAEKIVTEAVSHFGLDPSPSRPYVLTHNGRVLSLSEKIDDLGLETADVVIIEAGQPVDG